MNAIEIKNLSKRYPGFTLGNINLLVPTGSIVGLVGENGAGKSTTISLIMNSIRRDDGQVFVLGKDNTTKDFDDVKQDVGVVLDEAYFPTVFTVKNVNKVMENIYSNWDSNCFFELITKFSLPLTIPFKDFSRGMKMKLSIAVAMSHNAKLLILDEATGGLDPIVRDEILDLLNEYTRSDENSILMSSHIVSDLEKICDYIAFIHKGKLVLFEETGELIANYGIIHCKKSEVDDIPEKAVIGVRESKYDVSVLVKRELVSSSAFEIDRASIEDVILYMVRGEK